MYPHRIRLRGPWELHGATGVSRVTLPVSWQDLGQPVGPCEARLVRRFGMPRTLDEYERVWIACTGLVGSTRWSLNEVPLGDRLGSTSYFEMEVTHQLKRRNQLVVEIESATSEGGLWGEVALEIRGPHFLKEVAIQSGTLAGVVVGEPKAPLEIYVLRFGRTVRYEHVTAAPGGQPFAFALPNLELDAASGDFPPWRVELVEGANRWFTVDLADPNG